MGLKSGYPKKDDNVAGGGKSFKAYVAVLLIDFFCIAVPYILFLTVSILDYERNFEYLGTMEFFWWL